MEKSDYKKEYKDLYLLKTEPMLIEVPKMSKMGENKIDGYFEYVVPPLEGLWWQEGIKGIDYSNKETFKWISMIRQP